MPVNQPASQDDHPLLHQIAQKLSKSRFFTGSLLIHVAIVVLFGGAVLFHAPIEQDDFTSEGDLFGDGGGGEEAPVDAPDLTEQADLTPPITPTTTAQMDAITTSSMMPSTFNMAPTLIQPPSMSDGLANKMKSTAKKLGTGSGLRSLRPGGMMAGRLNRKKYSDSAGAKKGAEEAVVAGLRWLKTKQKPDGTWGSNGHKSAAMTGLALLAFLGHGDVPGPGEFGLTVQKAIDALVDKADKKTGDFSWEPNGVSSSAQGSNSFVYAQGIVAYALGEAYTMTKYEKIKPVYIKAIKLIVDGQGPDGGWAYKFDKARHGDTSVSGWMMQALKAAALTEIPEAEMPGVTAAMNKAMKNLDRVYSKGNYGYEKPGDRAYNLAGVGVLCKLMWTGKKDADLRSAARTILSKPLKYSGKDANLYIWYYHGQAAFLFGGNTWSQWNRMFQSEVVKAQSRDGSWPPTGGFESGQMNTPGPDSDVYRTSLSVLMLEVFYRYLPTTKVDVEED